MIDRNGAVLGTNGEIQWIEMGIIIYAVSKFHLLTIGASGSNLQVSQPSPSHQKAAS